MHVMQAGYWAHDIGPEACKQAGGVYYLFVLRAPCVHCRHQLP